MRLADFRIGYVGLKKTRPLGSSRAVFATSKLAIFPGKIYNLGMKKFRYKFSTAVFVLIIVGIVVCAGAIIANTVGIIVDGSRRYSEAVTPSYIIIEYVLIYVVSIILMVLLAGLPAGSYYSVDEEYFKTSFGVVKSKFKVENIIEIILDRSKKKRPRIAVYFDNDTYIVVSVKDEWQDELIDALIAVNPNIEFSIKSEEPGEDDKKK